MSKMAELSYDIQELYIEGFNSRAIAEELGCPLEIVTSALKEMNVALGPATATPCRKATGCIAWILPPDCVAFLQHPV